MDNKTLLDYIYALQEKVAYQDDLLSALNDQIVKQDKAIADLWAANRLLKTQISEVKDMGDAPQANQPPPHY